MNQTSKRFQIPNGRAANEMMDQAMTSAKECISDYPASAVFSAFGVGFGLGICLALLFSGPSSECRSVDMGLREKFNQFLQENVPWIRS